MILICGIPSEAPVRLALTAARAAGVPHVLFNQRESQQSDMHLVIDRGVVDGTLRLRETDWPLAGFSGIYARLMDYRHLPENQPQGRTPPDAARVRKSALLHATLDEWLEMADCRVMNRSSAMRSNSSKPYQAQQIRCVGFRIPETLITNDPAAVQRFLRKHGSVVYKSTSGVRSIVRPVDDAKLADLARVRFLPTQFQAFVPGDNVRVHVVGETLFATEIHTEAVDYRYAVRDDLPLEMVPVELPPSVAERCRTLARRLHLPLCGIDLKRTPDGVYYCFEVNPSPGYSYYQEQSGQNVAAAIVDYLYEGSV